MVRLMGVDSLEWINFTEELADLLKSWGANATRWGIHTCTWKDNPVAWTGTKGRVQEEFKVIFQWLKDRGIRPIVIAMGNCQEDVVGYPQMKADVIMNHEGRGDEWITDYGDVIAKLQPWGITVMGEPHWVQDTNYKDTMTQEQFFEAYRQFVIRALNAWRQIKPDLVGIVTSCPFWDLKPMAANPIPLPNIIYKFGVHYCYEDVLPIPEWITPATLAYWNATTPQELEAAKALQYEEFLQERGVQAMLDAGLRVDFQETGAGNKANNAEVWMQDVYDFCKARNMGVLHHNFRPYPRYPQGILQEGTEEAPSGIWRLPLTLNSMGELWRRNMPTPKSLLVNLGIAAVGLLELAGVYHASGDR